MKNRLYTIVFLIFLCLGMYGCSPSVREARQVVAQADSLRAEGGMYSDSVTLAQAYESLYTFRYLYPTDFAHACYHYGRLLREKENPIAAMECFIRATHSRTRDYHILGRVYSNMGSICHLASEFQLSYEMYEHSADMFLRANDSIAYFYALNDMAFELSEQGKEEETIRLINTIMTSCSDADVRGLTTLVEVTLYDHIGQYDSVLNCLCKAPEIAVFAASKVIKARAYEHTAQIDSAVYYAQEVLSMSSAAEQDRYNALYIILNYDSALQTEDLIALSAQRSDIETDVLIPLHNRWAVAVKLLEQDLHRQPDWSGYVVLILLLASVIEAVVLAIIWKKRKQQMQVLADEQANNIVESIKKHVDTKDLNTTLRWKNYDELKTEADLYMGGIVSKLETYHLNETEIRFCVLTVLDFSLKQIADTIHYGYPSGIKTLKKRTADKLSTTPPKLRDFLLHLLPKT